MNEKTIQKACLDLLESLRQAGKPVYATRTNSGFAGREGRTVALCRKGWPDITACVCGEFVGIETKRPGVSKLGGAQEKAKDAIQSAGGAYLLVNRMETLKKYLEGKGIL